MKIVIDTNALIPIISKRSAYRWIFENVISGKIQLCVSTEILFEYKEILQRKTNELVSENLLSFIISSPYTIITEVYFDFDLIKVDKSDNKFVDCAIAANAQYIVSDDNHFQALKVIKFPKVNVLTLTEFDKLLKF